MSANEITKGVLDLLADIAKREKQKAINKDEYFDAFLATLFESWFRDARKSFDVKN